MRYSVKRHPAVDNSFALLALFLSPSKTGKTKDGLRRLISENKIHWESLLFQANTHMCTPLWFSCLRQDGLLALLPDELQKYLEHLFELNRERNISFFNALEQMLEVFEENGIRPLLLKGAAAFCDGLYPDHGARLVQDIDVLVPESDAERAGRVLIDCCGYVEIPDPGKEFDNLPTDVRHHHINGLHKPGTPVVIEIHYRIGYARLGKLLPAETARENTEALRFRGQEAAVLSPTYRLIHNTVHALIGEADFIRGPVPLRQLAEFAFLAKKYESKISWRKWFEACRDEGAGTEAGAYLLLAHRLMGMPLPDGVPVSVMARFHAARLKAAGRFSATHEDVPKSGREKILGPCIRSLVKAYYLLSLPAWTWQNVCFTGEKGHFTARLKFMIRKALSPRSRKKI